MAGRYSFKGLTDVEVEQSRAKFGKNEIPPTKIETFWEKLIENFEDPLIRILCVALGITVILAFVGYADWFEGFGIAMAVFLATFVSTYSEYKNESSFQKLQEQASRVLNKVFRNGEVVSIFVTEIVVGDFVLLQAGDKVPADGSLVEGAVGSNQMSLTGEPEPVPKIATKGNHPISRDLLDKYTVFRGSVIEEGEAVMLVDKIGTETEYGKSIKEMEDEDRESPLQLKLKNLAEGISSLGYIGATFIFLSFLFKQFIMDQGYNLENTVNYLKQWQMALHDTVTALILSIIIIVVAVPEGLPMMIAIVLSLNMQKLLDRKVLVRQLLGIETSGSLNVLFSDKTGTITHGHLQPHVFVSGDNKIILTHTKQDKTSEEKIPTVLRQILNFCLKYSTASHVDTKGNIIGGNASDRAFLTLLEKSYLMEPEKVTRVSEILFSSLNKYTATNVVVNAAVTKKYPKQLFKENKMSIIKGAPEKLLPFCKSYFSEKGTLTPIKDLSSLNETIDNFSHAGIRVIAVTTSYEAIDTQTKNLPKEMFLLGFLGLRDEIRKESKHSIKICKQAGIQVVMITGDRKETAISIAREVGLLPETGNPGEEGSDTHLPRNSVLTSDEIHKMTDEELSAIIPEVAVIARALPTDKSRLVYICQQLNKVVGMTGDGVNDAAALKKADVGFAMGSGTEMAKEAADIVIMDDNFDSIATSILYGRTIFRSIRKFIIFQSTINVASTLIVFIGPFLGFDFPLTLIQLLWVNLVMDTLAALAFGGEPALIRYMSAKPIRRNESILNPYMWSSIMFNGIFIAGFSVFCLVNDNVLNLFSRNGILDNEVFLTSFFGFFIFITTINAFNVRTHKINIFDNICSNFGFLLVLFIIFAVQILFTEIGGNILRTVPLTLSEWGIIIGASFIIIPWDMLRKVIVTPCLPNRLKIEQKKKSV